MNLVGPLAVTQALLPVLRRGRGSVVNVTSAAGQAGVPLMAPYVSAKHALEGLSDVMRLEFRQLGIHVAIIEPGFVGTEMGDKLQRDTEGTVGSLPEEGGADTVPHLASSRRNRPACGDRFAARGRRQGRPARLDQ